MSSEADTPDDPKASARPREVFSVYASVSGTVETFGDPLEAGRAFFLAVTTERHACRRQLCADDGAH